MTDEKNHTEEIVVAKKGKQWPQWIAVLSASLIFFSSGICLVWSSPSLAILQSDNSPFPVSNEQASWIASLLPIGCAVGSVIGACLARYYGPKQTTMMCTIPFLIGFGLIIFATNPIWLYASRTFCGIGVGGAQTATPIYVAEISENHNRGALMSFFVLNMSLGGLFVSSVGPFVSIFEMAGISIILPVLMLATMVWLPDSPYFLMRTGNEKKCYKSLMWLRRQKNDMVIQEEMRTIEKISSSNSNFIECLRSIKDRSNQKASFIVNVTILAQQLCGAVVVMFYQEQINETAKVPIRAEIAVIITSVIGTSAGILSILFVDRWGRKPLLVLSGLGCAASTGLLGIYFFLHERNALSSIPNVNWAPVIALNALQVFFSLGLCSVPSTQVGEMFTSEAKELAFCALTVIASIEGFVLIKCYQIVQDAYGLSVVFWGLSSLTIVMLFIMYLIVPETKGKSFLEIQNMLSKSYDEPKANSITMREITRF